jgi:hypothetical protein
MRSISGVIDDQVLYCGSLAIKRTLLAPPASPHYGLHPFSTHSRPRKATGGLLWPAILDTRCRCPASAVSSTGNFRDLCRSSFWVKKKKNSFCCSDQNIQPGGLVDSVCLEMQSTVPSLAQGAGASKAFCTINFIIVPSVETVPVAALGLCRSSRMSDLGDSADSSVDYHCLAFDMLFWSVEARPRRGPY